MTKGETALQVLFFMKDEKEYKKLLNFLKRYDSEMLISIPVKIPRGKR